MAAKKRVLKDKLTHEEELQLVEAWQKTKCRKSLAKLLHAYKPFITSQATKSHNRNPRTSLDDCVQVATESFIVMIDKFNPLLGFRLSTFGMWQLKSALHSHGRTEHIVKQPHHGRRRIMPALLNERAKHPDWHEPLHEIFQTVGEKLNIPSDEIEQFYIHSQSQSVSSIDKPLNAEDEGAWFSDILVDTSTANPDEIIDRNKMGGLIEAALRSLPAREERVLRERFGMNAQTEQTPLRYLSEEFGVSVERVRQIEKNALTRMRTYLSDHGYEGANLADVFTL